MKSNKETMEPIEHTESTESTGKSARRTFGIEENLKKALTELLILQLFSEDEHYIGELAELMEERSGGALHIVFPYAAIYRMTESGHLIEVKRRIASDGRRRQFYAITDQGLDRFQTLRETYFRCIEGANKILAGLPEEPEQTLDTEA